jgi:predicted ATPase
VNPFVPDVILQNDREAPLSAKELVGRSAELDALLASIAPIFSGRFAGLVYVDGEAGLGKSYLVETARHRLEARDAPFLWIEAPCDQTLQRSLNAFEAALEERFEQSPGGPKEENLARFDRLLTCLAARLPPGDEALRDALLEARSIYAALLGHRAPGSLYERLSPKDRFDRSLAAIATWVHAESTQRPVILHLEDAHWADGDTLRAVQGIVRLSTRKEGTGTRLAPRRAPSHPPDPAPPGPAGLPIAVVCTARYTDDGGPFRILLDRGVPVRDLPLVSLPAEDIGRIAANVSGRPLSDPFRAMLIEGAGGNPFFAEEICAYWSDVALTEASIASPASPSGALPPTDVTSLVVAQIDRLPPRVKLTVVAAAALGKEFDLRVLSAMGTGDPEVEDHLRVAVAQRIFVEQGPGRYGFRNTLLRNAAYQIPARAHLSRVHLLAAEAIEAVHRGELERHYAALGRHYRRAGMPERARPYFLSAAREAAARYAHTEAKRHYQSYFKLVSEPTAESAVARYELGRDVYEPRGDFAHAFDEHARVIEEAQLAGDGATEALGRLGLGRVAWAAGHPDEARTHLTQALASARSAEDRRAEALILAHLALVHKASGLLDEARDTFDQALRLGVELGLHEGATVFGQMVAHAQGQLGEHGPLEALALYERALDARTTRATMPSSSG